MTNPIIAHNTKAAAMWNAAGREYERISRSIADSVEHCITRVQPKRGERVLDIATGTGWTARQLALRGAEVVAVDLAEDLIDAAKAIAREAGLNIEFLVGDAERLDFDDASFDVVISTCGVMFAQDPEAAAAELARVCKKGGRIGLTTWPAEGAVAALFKVMKPYMPEAESPLPPSPFEWGNRDRVVGLLGGHFDLRFETGTTVLRAPDSISVWELFLKSYGPTKTLAGRLPRERLQAMKNDFLAYHDQFKTDLGVALPRNYLVTIGVRC